jgi:hypothetical protein
VLQILKKPLEFVGTSDTRECSLRAKAAKTGARFRSRPRESRARRRGAVGRPGQSATRASSLPPRADPSRRRPQKYEKMLQILTKMLENITNS